MDILADLQNALIFGIPVVIYAVVVALRHGFGAREIAKRLGLSIGAAKGYVWAAAICVPFCCLTALISQWTKGFEGSMLAPFADQPPSVALITAAFSYGFIATGIPEELLFRGLIGGAIFRRFAAGENPKRIWTANIIQAVIFTLPHLLILLVAPKLWPLATVLPMALGLACGWLRFRFDSIGPGILVHALPNAVGALAVMAWW